MRAYKHQEKLTRIIDFNVELHSGTYSETGIYCAAAACAGTGRVYAVAKGRVAGTKPAAL
ncbi:MAG TPA: hypothetical protein VFO86_04170 [Terriglobia bacterium]|nr:hypothetical protein [Terriglobia bacterium]